MSGSNVYEFSAKRDDGIREPEGIFQVVSEPRQADDRDVFFYFADVRGADGTVLPATLFGKEVPVGFMFRAGISGSEGQLHLKVHEMWRPEDVVAPPGYRDLDSFIY